MLCSKRSTVTIISILIITITLNAHFGSINVIQTLATNQRNNGHWGPIVDVGLIPVAAAVIPQSNRVLLWAADQGDVFEPEESNPDTTITAIYDPVTGKVTDPEYTTLHHGMFCPGISLNFQGQIFVTGGKTAARTSIFDQENDSWKQGHNMTRGRGYHSQVTLSSGKTFTIGGSWSGGIGGDNVAQKDGEIFDPEKETWTALPGCQVRHMLTRGNQGAFESDNHAWLFAWKDQSVFQAGPSRSMNWYDTQGFGGRVSGGLRAHDGDAMNGNAVMFDAIQGQILTLGGAPSYAHSLATRAAHIITLDAEFALPTVEPVESMHFARVYANSVLLPTGDVFVSGGASYALQWTDKNASLVPELWDSRTRKFQKLARMPVPRTYHSMALLLPDATILTGGGGLCYKTCADWTANHKNIQVFTPPYLLQPDGTRVASRPEIKSCNATAKLGQQVTMTTSIEISTISLVRYGSATHSINTDQRRIPLIARRLFIGTDDDGNFTYQVKIPNDPGIAVPGYWMVFAIDKRGVPSTARTIHLGLTE